MIRVMWRSASAPRPYFQNLAEQESAIAAGILCALSAFVTSTLLGALGFIIVTGSDAYLPVLAFALVTSAGLSFFFWGLGALVIQRPANLDVRAWEIMGWSWSPLLLTSISLLPAILLVAISRLPVSVISWLLLPAGMIGAWLWHLRVLAAALHAFAPGQVTRSLVFYLIFIFALPFGLLTFLFVVFA